MIKTTGYSQKYVEMAYGELEGMSTINGFVFGYVDEKNKRCISFWDIEGEALPRSGQEYVKVFKQSKVVR